MAGAWSPRGEQINWQTLATATLSHYQIVSTFFVGHFLVSPSSDGHHKTTKLVEMFFFAPFSLVCSPSFISSSAAVPGFIRRLLALSLLVLSLGGRFCACGEFPSRSHSKPSLFPLVPLSSPDSHTSLLLSLIFLLSPLSPKPSPQGNRCVTGHCVFTHSTLLHPTATTTNSPLPSHTTLHYYLSYTYITITT